MSFILIVGAGRVGSTVARAMLAQGHDVSVLDEDPLSHERLDSGMDTTWEDAGGRFTLGIGAGAASDILLTKSKRQIRAGAVVRGELDRVRSARCR